MNQQRGGSKHTKIKKYDYTYVAGGGADNSPHWNDFNLLKKKIFPNGRLEEYEYVYGTNRIARKLVSSLSFILRKQRFYPHIY